MAAVEKIPVITISRQYGAGGRTIAKALSQSFDIPWYDRDFVARTAASSGYSEEDIQREGEQLSAGGRFWNSVLNNSAAYASSHDGIFQAQKKVILDLAGSPCIIVGRCGDFILADEPNIIRIYIYAPYEARLEHCLHDLNLDEDTAKKMMKSVDEARDHYHMHYAGFLPNDQRFKEIMIDSSMLGIEGTADYLVDAVIKRFELD